MTDVKKTLPQPLLDSLKRVNGFDEEAFIEVHQNAAQVFSVRFNPDKITKPPEEIFPGCERVPWSTNGYYLPSRPAFIFDPLLHAGVYYVQEASGMFIEQCISQNTDLTKPLKVLDLCAAPGGKSTLLQSLINEKSLLVSNEVIKSRANVLEENMSKWGGANVIVSNNDPRYFAQLENFFDVMVVDAPCSGSGLFRRDHEAIAEWSSEAVATCSLRQRRILTDAYPALKKNALLIYSTCSYSEEEDEDICDWLMENFQLQSLPLSVPKEWNIVTTTSKLHGSTGYRFFPDKVKGEGFFVACFRKLDGEEESDLKKNKRSLALSVKEATLIHPWLKEPEKIALYKTGEEIFAFPKVLSDELAVVQSALYLKKAGVAIGKLMRTELVPAHELSISVLVNPNLLSISLNLENALQYLRKEEVTISTSEKGWAVVSYNGSNLGWIKLLGNRTNNYYPKEWRILKNGNN